MIYSAGENHYLIVLEVTLATIKIFQMWKYVWHNVACFFIDFHIKISLWKTGAVMCNQVKYIFVTNSADDRCIFQSDRNWCYF